MDHYVSEWETKKGKKGKAIELPVSSQLLPLSWSKSAPEFLVLLPNSPKQLLGTATTRLSLEGIKVSKTLSRVGGPAAAEPHSKT